MPRINSDLPLRGVEAVLSSVLVVGVIIVLLLAMPRTAFSASGCDVEMIMDNGVLGGHVGG